MLKYLLGERCGIVFFSKYERAATTMRRQEVPIVRCNSSESRMNSIYGIRDSRQRVKIIQPNNGLRYSSPWPWVRAILLSVMLWVMLGWYFWRLFH
jgi:hypothetical protein